jgi:hypothetical protein
LVQEDIDMGQLLSEFQNFSSGKMGNTGVTSTPSDVTSVPKQKYITGHSLEEHAAALNKAKAVRDTAAIKSITDDYDRELQYQKDFGIEKPKTATELKTQEGIKLKSDTLEMAKNLRDIISGKIQFGDKSTRETAINGLVGKLTLKQKEAENLGAVLSANEQALLQSYIPRTEEVGPSVYSLANQYLVPQFMGGGIKPLQTSRMADDEKKAKEKLDLLISGFEGKPITADTFSGQGPKPGYIESKVIPDIKENINKVLGIPAQMIEQEKQLEKLPVKQQVIERAKIAMGQAIGSQPPVQYAQTANQVLGEPLKGGDIVGRIEERAYNKPVTTALDVGVLASPFLPGLTKRGLSEKPGMVPGEVPPASTLPEKPGFIQGTLSRSVANIYPEDIINSEKAGKITLQATPGKMTPRSIAYDLKQNVLPKTGEYVDYVVNESSKKLGVQPGSQLLDAVMEPVKQNSILQGMEASPQEVKLRNLLESKMSTGNAPPEMAAQGQTWATNQQKLNETRKFLNQGLEQWFNAGKPTNTPANEFNALKWDASQAIKDILAKSDTTPEGKFRKALEIQHYAIAGYPEYSKAANMNALSQGGYLNKILGLIGEVTSPIRTGVARMAQGTDPVLNQILQGSKGLPIAPEPVPVAPSAQMRYLPSQPDLGPGIPAKSNTLYNLNGEFVPKEKLPKGYKPPEVPAKPGRKPTTYVKGTKNLYV